MWECLGLQAWEAQHLRSSDKSAPRRQEGRSSCLQVYSKGSRRSEQQRSDMLKNSASSAWEGAASGLAESIPFTIASAVCHQPCSPARLVLASPRSSAITLGVMASSGSLFGEPSFTFGHQKSLMSVTFPVYKYGRRYSHFTGEISAQHVISEVVKTRCY